jgi:uncharacterized protein VirK/YbjX
MNQKNDPSRRFEVDIQSLKKFMYRKRTDLRMTVTILGCILIAYRP